jgi:hypothetical protein
MGGIFVVTGLAIWWFFSRAIDPAAVTKFGMTSGGIKATMPDLVIPTQLTLNILAIACVALGIYQLVRPQGFGKRTNLVLGLVAGMFVLAFLTWAAGIAQPGDLFNSASQSHPVDPRCALRHFVWRWVISIAIEGMMRWVVGTWL